MKCIICNKEIDNNQKHCPNCGHKVSNPKNYNILASVTLIIDIIGIIVTFLTYICKVNLDHNNFYLKIFIAQITVFTYIIPIIPVFAYSFSKETNNNLLISVSKVILFITIIFWIIGCIHFLNALGKIGMPV